MSILEVWGSRWRWARAGRRLRAVDREAFAAQLASLESMLRTAERPAVSKK